MAFIVREKQRYGRTGGQTDRRTDGQTNEVQRLLRPLGYEDHIIIYSIRVDKQFCVVLS